MTAPSLEVLLMTTLAVNKPNSKTKNISLSCSWAASGKQLRIPLTPESAKKLIHDLETSLLLLQQESV